ncbi:MAG: hypothetical protein U5K69_27440 [Balneolaceae bacterium]|nr:hypothetical protein [Balneolaceae bacterium]
MNGAGDYYTAAGQMLDRIQQFTQTNDWILSGLDAKSSINKIRERVETATSLDITKDQAKHDPEVA